MDVSEASDLTFTVTENKHQQTSKKNTKVSERKYFLNEKEFYLLRLWMSNNFFFFNDVLAETESTTVTADFPNPPDSFYFFLNLALFFLNVGVWVKST